MDIRNVNKLEIESAPKGEITRFWVKLISDGLGNPINVPVMVARGLKDGPVLGLTAAVHGNELNGIPAIQRLFGELDAKELRGTVVGVPIVNVPSFIRRKRRFNDGTDLNHIMPGKIDGNVSQVYAYRIIHRVIHEFEYLLDLHTASLGRINSHYVRADLSKTMTAKLAELQNAQIVVNDPPSDGTLRGAADEMGICAVTLEVGNPNRFQKRMIRSGLIGIHNVLAYLKMTDDEIEIPEKPTVYCKDSKWIYTDTGGVLTVMPEVTDFVKQGELIATIRNIFGDVMQKYYAPNDGIVIGKSVSPVNQTGGRILHLGTV
ncbi:MAG: succinylglutamate desuccinylase/aspartoacylase family protein [Chitinophagales bacterium]